MKNGAPANLANISHHKMILNPVWKKRKDLNKWYFLKVIIVWMDERNKCFIDFYRFIDTIDINQIRFTLLIDISILIFIDLLLRANWQQKTTLHVQHTFLPLFCTTTTWIFLVSHFMEKKCRMCLPKILMLVLWLSQFQASPSPRAFVILFWKS